MNYGGDRKNNFKIFISAGVSGAGFTLVELIVSAALIIVLAGISIPIYRSIQVRNDLDLAVNIIVDSLRRAQVLSQANQGKAEWGVDVSKGRVVLFKGSSFASRDSDFDEDFLISDTISVSGLPEVVFSRLDGNPSVSGDIILTAVSGETRTLNINEEGRIDYDLAAAVAGDWTSPVAGFGIDVAGDNDGWKVWGSKDYAYMVRSSGSPDFIIINMLDPQNPVLAGSLDLPGNPRNIFVSDGKAYVVSSDNSSEFQIINVSNPFLPSLLEVYDIPGRADGRGVFIRGNRAYVTTNSSRFEEFFIFDITIPGNPVLLGSLDLGSGSREVVVLGNYAYVASVSNSQELQAVDISDEASPVLAGTLNLPGFANGNTIDGFGNIVALGRSNGEVFLIDVSSPADPLVLGSIDTGGSVSDISIDGSGVRLFLGGNTNQADFQALDISVLSSPSILGTLNLPANLNGVFYHRILDRILAVGDDNNSEFLIINPQ